MDSCSSNASSITSFDLEAEQSEVAEKPLSPVLSTSKLNRRILLDRKVNKRKSKIKLASKFNEDVYSTEKAQNVNEYQNISMVSQMRAVDVYEEQRRRYYELLYDGSSDDAYRDQQYSSESITEYSTIKSSPVQEDIHRNLETTVNYQRNQNAKTVRFCTAGGKCIDISEDSLRKGNEIFEDITGFQNEEILNDCSVFKNPTTTKNKLSKIPLPNQTRKNIIKTKATRSTYEEIKINRSDIMVRQTQVDCYEDYVQNDSSNDYSISNTEDSAGTGAEETFSESMNKIFSNKKFMEFSSSSMENVACSDAVVEGIHGFNYKKPNVINNNSTKNSNQVDEIYKPTLENIVDTDWDDTEHVQKPNEVITQLRNPYPRGVVKQVKRGTSLSPPRKGQVNQQEIIGNTNVNKVKNKQTFVQQLPLLGNIPYQKVGPGEEVNIDAATSKNLVIVTMAPTNCDGENSYRSIVELHRNTNFNHSNDSVQNFELSVESPEGHKKSSKPKKHQCEFLGFSTEEQQQAQKTLIKVTQAVERVDQGFKSEKKKNEKKIKKTKKDDRDKGSVELAKGDLQKREKLKHRKVKKEIDSVKGEQGEVLERKPRTRNASIARQNEPTHDTEVGDGVVKQEEIETVAYNRLSLVAEKCKKLNNDKKRKGPTDILPVHCCEQTEKDNENQTIELSPNQKKFKIEIDCNSKFRINISCNGAAEATAKAIEALVTDKTGNTEHSKIETNLNTQTCLEKLDSFNNLQQPKGKLVKKFINKAHKLYRDMRNSEINLAEKTDSPNMDYLIQKENHGNMFKVPPAPNKDPMCSNKITTLRKQNDSMNGSDPNYEELSEMAKETIGFGGFKTAGGGDIKVSEKALKSAKRMYETTYQDIIEETRNEPEINLGFKTAVGKDVKVSEKAVNRARRMYEHINSYMEEIKDNDQNDPSLHKDIKISEKTLNKAKKLFEILDQTNTAEPSQVEVEVTKEDKVLNRMKKLYDNLSSEQSTTEKVVDNIQTFATKPTGEMDKKEKQPTQNTNPFIPMFDLRNCGFRSASGNNVIISERAMSKAKKMFETVAKETEENKISEPQNRSVVEEPTKDRKKLNSGNDENNFKVDTGFRTGAGAKIGMTSKGLDKAKAIFGDLSYQAGDFDSYYDRKHDGDLYDAESFTAAQICHQVVDTPDFSMGDFISSDNTTFDKTFPVEEEIREASDETRATTKPLDMKTSKKAFELLEDVVETVDHALQSIDEKFRRPRLSASRKRLGMSKYKPINIPNEKLERAKLLFKEDLNSTVVNMCGITKPIKISQPATCSTPILKQQLSPVGSNCNTSAMEQSTYRSVIADSLSPTILLCEKTKGNIEDWFVLINNKVELMKMQLRDLEEKKSYLIYQKEVLEKTKSEIISPQPGILIRKKEHVKLHLKDLKTNTYYTDNIAEFILRVTPQNAEAVHFTFERSAGDRSNLYTTLDGALIIPSIHNIIGFTEIELAFKAMPGVDTKLIPRGWLENHFRLIIWKLASYERFLSAHLRGSLTVENVMQQLKYRYDREIDKAERPAVRKILEKDDIPQKRIVWCVSSIDETNKNEIELTDGWYCVKTLIDEGLAAQISKHKIKVGTKLVTTGAQIVNCDGCHPLEVPSNVRLRISFNSTRRAPWYSKLGYQRCAKSLLVPLHSIRPDGGMIGCIKIYIARVYPLRFMEQINDTKIWRNNKAEEKRARDFENERLSKMEKVHYEVQKSYDQERMQEKRKSLMEYSKLNRNELLKITCPKTLLSLLEASNDPDELMEYLSPSQRANVLDYRQAVCLQRQHDISKKIAEEMEKLKLAKRKVVSILKLLVLDASSESDKAYQFCIWNPSDEDLTLLREYNVYYTYNILPRFNGELFSTNRTFFKLDRKMSHNKFKRQAYPIAMLLDPHYRPTFNEFDVVGVIIYLGVTESEQSVWLADRLENLLFIKVRDGPKFCRLLDDVVRGDVVSIQNLLYCPPQDEFGVAVANQFTIVSKSMQSHLRECMEMFKLQLPKDLTKFLGECTAKIERSSVRMDVQFRPVSDVPFLQCGLRLSPNVKTSPDDSSEENSVIPQKLTATDIAMSLIDTDQFI